MRRGRLALLALACWSAFGLLVATRLYIQSGDLILSLQVTLPQCLAWGLLTPLVFAADRKLLGRLTPTRRILAHVPLGLLFMSVGVAADYEIQKRLEVRWLAQSLAAFLLQNVPGAPMGYALIVGVSMAASYGAEARRREEEAAQLALHSAQLETRLAEARLRALQSQLNPHFLFNAFNAISALTETDPKTARRMMARLGGLLRASLDHAGRQEVTLHEELSFLEDYLAMERLRFEDRLCVDVEVAEGARDALVPSYVLQPLVENAVRHGTGALLRNGRVRLSARLVDDRLRLEVEDDGVGLPKGWRLEDHAGIGLSNIVRRLEELYGSGHRFEIADQPEGGVRVAIELPFRRGTRTAVLPRSDVGAR